MALIFMAVLQGGPAWAESAPRIHAVLVGAADYGDDPLRLGDLSGPRNDVLLMADVLVERGADPADIRLLMSRPERARYRPRFAVPIAGRPDLRGIREQLEAVRARVRPGDQVVIHLAGHGWRQREAIRGSELSGLDEVFLPEGYHAGREGVDRVALPPLEGVLIDDEIGRHVDQLRGLGADVVFIGDFCHAGDATRGRADFAWEPRRRSPWMETALDASDTAAQGRRIGAYVAFFAAPAGDRAVEGMAPIWAPVEQRAPHGLLSAYMATALADPAVLTWADAAARVQAGLIEHDVRDRAVRLDAPAQFEGQLDRPVLGQTRAVSEAWTVLKPALLSENGRAALDELRLNAGALHGLTEDSLVALYETRDGRERLMLYGRALDVGPAGARLVPADGPRRMAAAWADLRTPEGRPYTAERLWTARVEMRGAPLAFRVAVITDEGVDVRPLLMELAGDLGVEVVQPSDQAELYVHAGAKVIGFFESPQSDDLEARLGEIDMAGSSDLTPPQRQAWLRQALADAVLRAARQWRVHTILMALDGAGTGGGDLTTELYLWRPLRTEAGACPPYHRGHRGLTDRPPADAVSFRDLGLAGMQPSVLRPCDVIFARIVNSGRNSLDVTPLAFSPDGAVWALPWTDGRPAVRFEPGRARLTAIQLDPAQPVRRPREELAVIAVRADPQGGAPASFERLAQPGVGSRAPLGLTETTRSAQLDTPLLALLEQARFSPLRSASVPTAPDTVSVRRFAWRVERVD